MKKTINKISTVGIALVLVASWFAFLIYLFIIFTAVFSKTCIVIVAVFTALVFTRIATQEN